MTAAGLIFANIHDKNIPEMTRVRSMASIPFGCRYRLIDFALSNMVNSDITNVGIITRYNYQSLLDHVGNGKDWDLARRSGGIKILPPYVAAYENNGTGKVLENRLESLLGAENFIHRCGADYIVLSDCDAIMNVDLSDVLQAHVKSGAYMTIVTKRLEAAPYRFEAPVSIVETDDEGRVIALSDGCPNEGGVTISTNIMVISRTDLQDIVSEALARGYKSFHRDILARCLDVKRVMSYAFDGWYSAISSLEGYFESSMKLLCADTRRDLFGHSERSIYTKIRNSAPTKYMEGSRVTNSLLADGCVIEGTVENCILFRNVHVGKGTVIRDSVLFHGTYVEDNVELNCIVTDKDVHITRGVKLSGNENMPFYIQKGRKV